MTIIVVDPSSENLTELVELLQDLTPDNTVASFRDPLSAIKYAYYNPPDILFTEVITRPVNGFELIAIFRARYPDVKTAIVSCDGQDEEKAAALHIDAFLKKPVNICKLRAAAV